jgi:uncharacterized protein (TIGR00251 family)
MSPKEYNLHNGKRGSAIAVRVTPRASNNEVAEILHDGTIRIRLTAPPVEGKANQELAKFLSDILGVPKSNIEIVAGQSGRDKLVSILDMDAETAHQKILAHLA